MDRILGQKRALGKIQGNLNIVWNTEEKWSGSHSVVSNSLRPHGLYSPWNFPGQNSRVGSLSLLQGIFPTQGLNPSLPHCRWILYQLTHKGSPRKLEWVAFPFSRGSSQPRDWTQVFLIAGRFFTSWATGKPVWTLVNNKVSGIPWLSSA